jgi:hypothetical protein
MLVAADDAAADFCGGRDDEVDLPAAATLSILGF